MNVILIQSLVVFIGKWLVLRYVTPIERIREQRVRAHLLFFKNYH